MDFVGDTIELTGAWILLFFRRSKASADDIIHAERLKVWIIGLSFWIIFLTIFGVIAKYGFLVASI